MAKLKLTMAPGRYDRHVPFFDGTVKVPDGIELEMLKVGQSTPKEHGAGRANLEEFTGYLLDQGLIDAPLAVEDMFVEQLLDT